MSTWIVHLTDRRDGLRVAVKDMIDVVGVPTTGGSRVLASSAGTAQSDARCLAGIRAGGGLVAGKTNLHELACGSTGVNPHFGTPQNPLDPGLIPGGSSSGNAVALAAGEVELAIGTDTAGSIRTPSACCGTVGLKPTWDWISTEGVRALAPSLDVVGPMARDVAGVVAGLRLLDGEWAMDADAAAAVGRVRIDGVDPAIDVAIDALLCDSGLDMVDITLPGWASAERAAWTVLLYELWQTDGLLYTRDPNGLGGDVRALIERGRGVSRPAYLFARAQRGLWRAELAHAFARVPVLVWPTVSYFPPTLDAPTPNSSHTNIVVNFAGHPALAVPVPTRGGLPTSLQLVGPDLSEARLCATGLAVEAAVRAAA